MNFEETMRKIELLDFMIRYSVENDLLSDKDREKMSKQVEDLIKMIDESRD